MLLKTATNVIKSIAQRRFVLWLIMIINADNFVSRDHDLIIVIILLKGRKVRAEGPKFKFFFARYFNSFSILLYLGTTRTEISACKPKERLFRLLRSSSLLGGKQPLY